MERETDSGGIGSIVDAVPVHSGEERTEPHGKASSASQKVTKKKDE